MQNSRRFNTSIISLEKIAKQKFVIPTYQRPYVWKEEQINKLLKDCAIAFLTNIVTNIDKPYFIGTILTSDKKEYQELIDGQQRFTTLWLIAVVFHKLKINSAITKYLKVGEQLRLGFEIREEVAAYFKLLESNPKEALEKYSEEQLGESIYLKDISKAVSTIESILLSLDKDLKHEIHLKDFGDYLYSKVMMVNNITPSRIDLNKLFATINNSGVQLEQTDIIKANLLKGISTDKLLYSKIWECCENMNDYFERNIRKIFTATNWNEISHEDFSSYDSSKFKFISNDEIISEKISAYTIRNIIEELEEKEEQLSEKEEKELDDEKYCRSIISFGQLLLHTYRIFLKKRSQDDFEGTFHTKRLIEIFKGLEKETEEEVKAFFRLLWKVRYYFDLEVIKWRIDLDSKNEYLELTRVNENTSQKTKQFHRNTIERNDSTMLQSVLYFTGDYLRQYWLTPFLYRLLEKKDNSLLQLESIDNTMSVSLLPDKEISFELCDSNFLDENLFDIETELKTPNGTGFKHYWFQKLEYILWKNWDKNDVKFQNFRITSKNSVEHVFPQNHEFQEELEKELLDSFGNLGLLSVSQNSSYSNQSVIKKKEDFDHKTPYDSLKLALIYSDKNINNWGETEIKKHQERMIEKFKKHYKII